MVLEVAVEHATDSLSSLNLTVFESFCMLDRSVACVLNLSVEGVADLFMENAEPSLFHGHGAMTTDNRKGEWKISHE